jgi:hypothetical protein
MQDRFLFVAPSAPRRAVFDDERLFAFHLVSIIIITLGEESLFGKRNSLSGLRVSSHHRYQHQTRQHQEFEKRFHNMSMFKGFAYIVARRGGK